MKRQSFAAGAVILMIANAISKILGALLKIPLAYILREEGMAVYNIAFEVYIMLLSFVISGFPLAISRLCADAAAKGNTQRERKIVSVSTLMLIGVGLGGSGILYFGADFFAHAMKERAAAYAIKMIAPSVFLVALGTGYKSYFQGTARMIPVAVSQVAESFIKLAAGYALAVLFINYGIEKASGGAIMGVTAGEAVATIILAFAYIFGKRKVNIKRDTEKGRVIAGEIISVALPLLCASVVASGINVADTTLIRTRLLDGGLTADKARFLYGAYTGYALTVFHLPVGILATLGVSILPIIAGAYATGNIRRVGLASNMGLKIAVVLSLPCAVIMYFLSGDILSLLFRDSAAGMMLKAVAPCCVALCAMQMAAAVLQSAGKIMAPFRNALFGAGLKLVIEYFLAVKPEINIYASVIGATVCYTCVTALNFISLGKGLGIKINFKEVILKPLICAALMVGVTVLILPYFSRYGLYIRLGAVCTLSLTVYALTLFITGTTSVKEIRRAMGK